MSTHKRPSNPADAPREPLPQSLQHSLRTLRVWMRLVEDDALMHVSVAESHLRSASSGGFEPRVIERSHDIVPMCSLWSSAIILSHKAA